MLGGLALLAGLNGCAFFRSEKPLVLEPVLLDTLTVTLPDSTAVDSALVQPKPKPPPTARKTQPSQGDPSRPTPDPGSQTAAPAPRPDVPDNSPVLTVRLSPEEAAQLRDRIDSDMTRARSALTTIESRPLTAPQAEQLDAVRRFMTEADTATQNSDLRRAASLAEKARIIAEELRNSTKS